MNNKKKNILLLLPDNLIKPMGGMGIQAINIFSKLTNDYKIFTIGSSGDKQKIKDNFYYEPLSSVDIIQGNPDPIGKVFLSQSNYIEKGIEYFDKNIDIIHAFDWSTFYAGIVLSRILKSKLVVTIQLSIQKMIDVPHITQIKNFELASSVEYSGLLKADKIIQVSNYYKNLFPKIFNNKTEVIENGINLKEWKNYNKIQIGKNNNKLKVIYIGRFAEMKNIDSLLNTDIPENIELYFIGSNKGGDSNIQDRVIKKSKENNNIFYLGAKYNQDKIDYLCSADAVIIPSIHEPFGIVALEALASKSILLSSFSGGMSNFLKEDIAINCGITKESISESFIKLVEMGLEEKESRINNGLELCKKYEWSIQAKKLNKVYSEL